MRIFISYAREDRATAESLALALRAQRHHVFFDRDSLPAGEEFHNRIRRAIESADLMVFLLSPEAVDEGSYTLTELHIAQSRWKHPDRRLLPVRLRPVSTADLPPVLKAVTVFDPPGNAVAAVSDAVARIAAVERARRLRLAGSLSVVALAAALGIFVWVERDSAVALRTGGDGAVAAIVPGGIFTMGDDEEAPRRQVWVSTFHLDRHEVTVARYAAFLKANEGVEPPEDWESGDPASGGELPVVGVNWRDADAYCRWAGRRLPTEAEWEKAARGTDERRYPWGNASPGAEHANFQNAAPTPYGGGLSPVGAHPAGASVYGIEDMAGNAAEWVADWYSEQFDSGDKRDPGGPPAGEKKVVRGGGRFDPADRITVTKRYFMSPGERREDVGFRCALSRP